MPVGIDTKSTIASMIAGMNIYHLCLLMIVKMICATRNGVALYLMAIRIVLTRR